MLYQRTSLRNHDATFPSLTANGHKAQADTRTVGLMRDLIVRGRGRLNPYGTANPGDHTVLLTRSIAPFELLCPGINSWTKRKNLFTSLIVNRCTASAAAAVDPPNRQLFGQAAAIERNRWRGGWMDGWMTS